MKLTSIRKHILFFSLLFIFCQQTFSQNFTWMKGVNTQWGTTIDSALGVPAVMNEAGHRSYPASWRDSQGNFWVFGGFTYYASIGDLWKYDISNNTWTRVWDDLGGWPYPTVYGTQGVSSALNKPGSRTGSASWTDNAGNHWLFGGSRGYSTDPVYNDLWKYNPGVNQWTWMAGSTATNQPGTYGTQGVPSAANVPGSRLLSGTWTDANGDFWLFGGVAVTPSINASGYMNDLWKYSVSSNQWTWIKGSSLAGQVGVYGTQGVAAGTNMPGARTQAACWTDASGNFWMMGGYSNGGRLNDLWKYDPSTNDWTWISGSNLTDQPGNYGTLNVQSATNMPGSRYGSFGWYDAPTGNMYLFGGSCLGPATNGVADVLNDLWKYSPSSNQWTWIKGSSGTNQPGNYGTQGVTAASNMPGTRHSFSGWIDNSNNFWLFGGAVTCTASVSGPVFLASGGPADVWKYDNCAPVLSLNSSTTSICPGNTVTLSVTGASSYSWSTLQTSSSITVSPLSTTIYSVAGTNTLGCTRNSTVMQHVTPLPNLIISSTHTLLCSGETITLSVIGGNNHSWSNSQTSSSIVVAPLTTTTYSVSGANALGCSTSSAYIQNVAALPSLTITTSNPVICTGESVTLAVNGAVSYAWQTSTGNTNNTISDSPLQTTIYTVIGTSMDGCVNSTSFTQVVDACTGIRTNGNRTGASALYPNPNKGVFTISTSDQGNEPMHLIIMNSIGQEVFHQNLASIETLIHVDLVKGLYVYKVMNPAGKSISLGKLVIE